MCLIGLDRSNFSSIHSQVISFFHYIRSPYFREFIKIKHANSNFNQIFPEIDILMDFNSCVLEQNEECQYVENSDPNDYGGHRSLISHFCGHEEVKMKF